MRLSVALLFVSILSACSRSPVDPALAARQACFKELSSPEIHGAGDFLALGRKKEEQAAALKEGVEKQRTLRCALGAYEAAAVVNTADPLPLKAAGDFYYRTGDLPRASEQFEAALRLDPGCLGANLGLARIARRGGDPSSAARFLKLEMLANPRGDEVFFESGNMAMSEGKFALAERAFSKAFGFNPGNVTALYDRGVARRLLGRLKGALKDFREVAALEPEARANVYWQLGGVLEQLKKKREALTAYRRYLELLGSAPETLADRGHVEEKIRKLSGE